jgi:hypothetical protein
MDIGWEFPRNSNGSAQGFQDGAIDTFAGRRLSALVREVIQNSLDAHDLGEKPVTVEFSLNKISAQEFSDVRTIEKHVDRCREISEYQNTESITNIHKNALKLVRSTDDVNLLCISDSNTSGLTGPIDHKKPWGPWFALTKGTGLTQKINSSSLGSFGHGSKAPFAMSKIRTVFYLSNTVNEQDEEELRFQGKSILQTHLHPVHNETTQGVGFFGDKENMEPLLNNDIPNWARQIREQHSHTKGTTIIIPYTSFNEGLFPETKITVIANFFYAIKLGKLKVIVNNEIIDQSNVADVFAWCESKLETEQDEIDIDHVKACFASIRSILEPTFKGSTVIPDFGQIDWYIRLSDEITYKAVAIARQSGMLITKRPPKLERFPGLKPFDMFVFVNEGNGSTTLKRLENPAHDNFEFDRITDANDAKEIKRRYDSMQQAIRNELSRVSIDSSDKVKLTELSKILFDLGTSDDKDANTERGESMYISSGTTPKQKPPLLPGEKDKKNSSAKGVSNGIDDGDGGGKRKTGNIPGDGDRDVKVDTQEPDKNSTKSIVRANNLRIKRLSKESSNALISFTSDFAGEFIFQLKVVGESESSKVSLIHESKSVDGQKVTLTSPGRQVLEVQLADKNEFNFTMEGWLNEIS